MPSITITDLTNAKLDVDHIAEVATSTASTAADRLGNIKDTVKGAVDSLKAYNSRGAWAASTVYALKDLVTSGGSWYVCVLAHTSSAAFATDSASKWRVHQGLTAPDLAVPGGAVKVGYDQGTVASKLLQTVSIQDKGGKDDFGAATPTDNAIALAAITAAYPGGCIIKFPKTDRAAYDFLSYGAGNLNNYVYDVDEGVTLRFPGNALMGQSLARFVRDTRCYHKDLNTFYTMKENFSNTASARYHLRKTQFLGPGDRDTTLVSAVDMTAANIQKFDCAWPNGPFTASSSISGTARKADIALAAGNAGFKVLNIPCVPGMEYSCWFDSPAGWDGFYFFGVATQNGYDVLYESMVPGTGASRMVKEFSGAAVNSNVPYLGSGNHYSTWAKNGICTVRCLAHNCFVVLVNGVERYRSRATNSPISGVLFGAGFGTNAATVSVRDMVATKHKQTAGQKPIRIMAIGDSITDAAIHGNWANYMSTALEGTMGIRVREMRNIAVSGAKASDQYASLVSASISDIDVAVILIGVNDIQAQTNPDTDFAYNVGRILDRFNAAGIPCVVGVPTQFFSRALAAASTSVSIQGVDSSNYEKGAGYRGRLIYEVATRNTQLNRICFGTLEELGPVLSDFLVDSQGVDSIVYDNIHPTSHARQLMGYSMARSVAGLLAPRINREYPATRHQASTIKNSWTDATAPAGFEIDESGWLKHYGLLDKNGGSLADGTQVMLLPPFLRPSSSCRIVVAACAAGGGFAGSLMLLVDSATGSVTIFGAPAGAAGIYLDNLQYKLNW